MKCVDVRKSSLKTKWFIPWGTDSCERIGNLDEAKDKHIEADDIVFAVHIPPPQKEMSPWFQFMLYILQMDIAFKSNNQISKYLGRITKLIYSLKTNKTVCFLMFCLY